jgi:SEC-C motif-containing protein
VAYLEHTWASATRPADVRLVPDQVWTGLAILDIEEGSLFDQTGIVEFEASFERAGQAGTHHERSTFTREGGRWVYLGPVD